MNQNGTNDFFDFIYFCPRYKKFVNNPVAKNIFDELSQINNIRKMIIASNAEKPALAQCITDLENKYGNQPNIFNFMDDFTKQCLGTMVKVVLQPFGYAPTNKQKKISRQLSHYVTSATVYNLDVDTEARLRLTEKIAIETI